MKKLLSILFAASLVTVSFGAFAASHGGAMKDGAKVDCKGDQSKLDDKAKAECKKMEEKKPEAKK